MVKQRRGRRLTGSLLTLGSRAFILSPESSWAVAISTSPRPHAIHRARGVDLSDMTVPHCCFPVASAQHGVPPYELSSKVRVYLSKEQQKADAQAVCRSAARCWRPRAPARWFPNVSQAQEHRSAVQFTME